MFTIITIAYWKLPLLKKTINTCLNQTYENIELIIINNGAFEDIIIYIDKIAKLDKRVKIINFEENIFSWDDPEIITHVCLNTALEAAKGDYVFFTSYDDPMALDYVERMVSLFEDNPDCTTAAGRCVSIYEDDSINKQELNNRKTNFRPKYMQGNILAKEILKGKNTVFSAPGTIFTIKRDVFLNYGGFHRAIEWSQLYGIVPFGVTGFDEDAIYYWRRHEGQLNIELTKRGFTGFKYHMDMLKDNNIYGRWQIHGDDTAKYVVNRIIQLRCYSTATHAVNNFYVFNFKGFINNLYEAHGHIYFWIFLLKNMILLIPKLLIRKPIVMIIKATIRFIDKRIPAIKFKNDIFNKLVSKSIK
jgi:glycosyltransferase involved in cell wall biosynthesis